MNALSSGPAGAQTASPAAAPADTVALPDIVVSATGTSTPAEQVGSSVTVITADQIQNQQRDTVNDVLAAVPGLNIVQTGSPGGQTSVFMRGANSNQVKVLIDGIDVSDPSNPNASFDFGQLLTGDIARIEVLRGPQSGLYGADAIGGVISITTKTGSGPPKATASVEGGSFGTFNQNLGLSGSSSIFNYSFNIDHFHSADTPVTPAYTLPPGDKANPNYYDNYTYSTRLGADLTDTFSVDAVARYTDSKLLYTGDCCGVPDAMRSRQFDHQLFTRGEAIWHTPDNRFTTTAGIAYSNIWTLDQYPLADFTSPTTSLGERVKSDIREDVKLSDSETLILGAEHETYSLDTGSLTASNENNAGFAELQSSFFNRLFVASNIRYDDNQSYGGHFTYRIAPSFIILDTDTKLLGSIGTGFKAPSLSQLYQNYPAFGFYANPNLQPEESTGYDVGFEQPFLNNGLRIGSTYFQNDIKNLIADNAFFTTDINIGRARIYGDESFVSFTVNDQLKLRADYTYTIAKDEDTGLYLLRRPKNKASLQADWTPMSKLHLSSTILYVGSWYDGDREFTNPYLKASPYMTVNLAANYDINAQTSLFFHVDNLFDRQYEDPVGFLHPGIGVYGGVRVSSY